MYLTAQLFKRGKNNGIGLVLVSADTQGCGICIRHENIVSSHPYMYFIHTNEKILSARKLLNSLNHSYVPLKNKSGCTSGSCTGLIVLHEL